MPTIWVILLSVSEIDMNYTLLCLTTKSKLAPGSRTTLVWTLLIFLTDVIVKNINYNWICPMIISYSRNLLRWSVFRSQKWPPQKNRWPELLSKHVWAMGFEHNSPIWIQHLHNGLLLSFLHQLVKQVVDNLFNGHPHGITRTRQILAFLEYDIWEIFLFNTWK